MKVDNYRLFHFVPPSIAPLPTGRESFVYVSYSTLDYFDILIHLYFFKMDRLPSSDHVNDCWLPIEGEEDRYLKIDANPKLVNGSMPFHPNVLFWNQLMTSDQN